MTPDDFQKNLDAEAEAKKAQQDRADQIGAVTGTGDNIIQTMKANNDELKGSIHDLLLATLVSKDPKIFQEYIQVARELSNLLGAINKATGDVKGVKLEGLSTDLKALQQTLVDVPTQIEQANQSTDPVPHLKAIAKTLGQKNFNPKVTLPPVDLSPLTKILGEIKDAVSKTPETSDNSAVVSAVSDVKEAITGLQFPVANYVLPFKDVNGKAVQVQLDGSGNVPTTGGGGGGGGAVTIADGADVTQGSKADAKSTATDTTPITIMQVLKEISFMEQAPASRAVTNAGTFAVQATLSAETTKVIGTVRIADGSGNLLTSTTNALDVNIKSGFGTSITANQGTAAAITAGWPVIGGELADTTGTFTNATQTNSVTSSNFDGYSTVVVSINGTYGTATGVFEVSDDSGTTWYSVNAARVDGSAVETGYTTLTNTNRMWTLSVSGADQFRVRSTAVASGTVNVRISVESMPTPEAASVTAYQPTAANLNATVVGTGAFVVQATLAAETTKVIGTVNQGTNPWVTSNATTSVVGNGAAATAQRVTLANDSTGIVSLTTSTASIGKLAANSGVIIGDVNIVSAIPGVGATSLGKAEDAAAASGDTGIAILGVRNDTLAGAQTNANGDYGSPSIDTSGIQIVAGAPRALKGRAAITLTSTTTETTLLAATASTFHDAYGLILTNTSATVTKVTIRDATGAGTATVFEVPATDTRGFMLPVDSAIPQTAVNTAWTAQCGTSVASLEATLLYVSRV